MYMHSLPRNSPKKVNEARGEPVVHVQAPTYTSVAWPKGLQKTVSGLVENKAQTAEMVRNRFREADASGNGAIDLEEAVQLIGTLCGEIGLTPPRDDKVAKLLSMCDASGDGELQLDEFEKFFAVVLRDAHKKAARDGLTEVGVRQAGVEETDKLLEVPQVITSSGAGTPERAAAGTPTHSSDSAALFALHDEGASNGEVVQRATTATELLQALHFVPAAFRGSKWSGVVHMKVSRSFSIGIIVDGERASVDYRKPDEGGSFLVMTAERDVLMGMLEGTATVAMLVLSGAIHVDDWENALLFQEAFDFDPKAYAKWKEGQQYLLLRPRHSDAPTELAGGADLDEDVEASLQHVIAERARQAQGTESSKPGGGTTYVLNSLLCCAARKVA